MSNHQQQDFSFAPQHLLISSLRDSGYRNTAHALAELIDNSIQASSNVVEVFCEEKEFSTEQRKSRRPERIAVLDNGSGMEAEILRISLQLGNGKYLNDRSGIGRFGMGLPSASISQARRVDVWTWQNGPDNALYSYLDLDEIQDNTLKEVPAPEPKPLPNIWHTRSNAVGNSGTLVLWSNLEESRLTWHRATTMFNHTEEIIGRIYRKFINQGRVQIRLITISPEKQMSNGKSVKPNDPLYLMENTSTPEPYNESNVMFEPFGDRGEQIIEIQHKNEVHCVAIRCAIAKQDTVSIARDRKNDRGQMAYGKHAAKNRGLSLMRADRELSLSDTWCDYDPRERWWGIEVDFPPELDEIFGVTNNKQEATHFESLARYDYKNELQGNEKIRSEVEERLQEEGDPKAPLIAIVNAVQEQINLMRNIVRKQGKKTKSSNKDKRYPEDSATETIEERSKSHPASSDGQIPSLSDKDKITEILEQIGETSEEAVETANLIIRKGWRVKFVCQELDSRAMFSVKELPQGLMLIIFNILHPAHKKIMDAYLFEDNDSRSHEEILSDIKDALELLFISWGRYEIESGDINSEERKHFKDIRYHWGVVAEQFLKNN